MNKLIRRLALCLLAVLLLLATSVFAEGTQEAGAVTTVHTAASEDSAGKTYEQYVRYLFGLELTTVPRAASSLSEAERVYYDFLRQCILEVAAGTRTSTEFTTDLIFDLEGDAFQRIINALLADLPYELFWYDKYYGGCTLTIGDASTFSFCVLDEYAEDTFTVDAGAIQTANAAVANAKSILSSYAGAGDYDKLVGYMNEICSLTDYNYDAFADTMLGQRYENNNPWALIWVFDGDPDTKVVCEGYAEAFQYLCDKTSFEGDVKCRSVTGTQDGVAHMWNLVRMPDGGVYLADITACDSISAIASQKFLVGYTSGSAAEGYTAQLGTAALTYVYDDVTLSLFSTEALTLADKNYTPSDAEDGEYTSGDWTYQVSGGIASILSYNGTDADVTVPAELDGYPVKLIAREAFDHNDYIEKLTISEGIETLAGWAIYFCASLKEVVLPSTVVLYNPDYYQDNVFGLDGGDKWIYDCYALETFQVSEDNPNICSVDGVIYSKDMSTLMHYPAGKKDAAYTIPADVVHIASHSFAWNFYLEKAVLPNTVHDIGYWAFIGCSSLREINIPEGCCWIGQFTFQGTALTSLHLPSTLSIFPAPNFAATKVSEITIADGNTIFRVEDGLLRTDTTLIYYLAGQERTSYTVPSDIQVIDQSAFESDSSLVSIVIPESVQYINSYAFFNHPTLNYVTIPATTQVDDIFPCNYPCFVISEKGSYVETVVAASPYHRLLAFVDIESGGIVTGSCGEDVTWAYDIYAHKLTFTGTGAINDYIPYVVEGAPEWRKWCDLIKSVEFGEGITSIGSRVCWGCWNLESVSFPSTLEHIGEEAFWACRDALREIVLPASVKTVDTNAFGWCDSLSKLICFSDDISIVPSLIGAPENQTVFYGYSGSSLEAFCQQYSYTFIPIVELSITGQPADAYAAENERAVVTVSAEGSGLTYEWYFRNAGAEKFTFTPTYTTNTYSVLMNEARDGRQLYCVVIDAFGNSVTTDVVTLHLSKPLIITGQPVSVNVLEGERAEVTLTAEGDGLTYEWYYKPASASKFYKTTSFTGNRYYVTMTEDRAGRQVYCVVTDVHGNSVTSDTVTLDMAAPVSLTSQPVDAYAPEGERAIVTVSAQGIDLTYAWYFRNAGAEKFTFTPTYTTSTYSVLMNEARDGRQLYCVVTDAFGNSVTTDVVTLHMAAALSITRQPVSVKVPAGERAEVSLTAVGDGLTYEWYYKPASASKFYKTTSFTGSRYYVTMTGERAGRQVYCVVTDQYGNTATSDIVTLDMPSPVAITEQPQDVYALSGDKAVIQLTAEGDGLTYAWYYKNAGAAKFSLTTTFTGSSYTTSMTSARNGRQVYCVVTDQYGNTATSDVAELHLVDSVVITVQPVSVSAAIGEKAEVRLTAVGEGLTYEWYYKPASGTKFYKTTAFTSNRYYVTMTEERAGRQVYCVVTDADGNSVTSDTVTLNKTVEASDKTAEVVLRSGDVNGDGVIDMLDSVDYTKWLHGEEVFFLPENADLNGDGIADEQDLSLLMTLYCTIETEE